MSTQRDQGPRILRGMLLLSIAVFLFAVMDTLSKYLTLFYPVATILWARYLFHTLLVVSLLAPRLGFDLVRTNRPGIQVLRALLLASTSLVFVTATKYMPIAEATAIQFLSPLIVTLLAVVFLNEKVEPTRWIAVLAGFIGVLVIIRPGSGIFTVASFLPLASAFLFASYQVMTRQYAILEGAYTLIFYPGVIGLMLMTLALPMGWTAPQSLAHMALLAVGGILGGTSHLIMIKAYEFSPASRLAPFSYMQVIWVTLGGLIVFGNFPDFWSLIGIAILVGSGLYVATHQHLQHRKTQE